MYMRARWAASRARTQASWPASANGFFRPRAGLSFRIDENKTVRASWLTGFRVPTMNELYRSFRVGNTVTAANPDLTPEKSSGPEIAFTMVQNRWTGRAIFYASRLNGAIYNRTLSSTAALIQRVRSNGDARALPRDEPAVDRAIRRIGAAEERERGRS